MGSKANDSRMGTTGLPDSSGINFRLTPAPEAVISTSSAPTGTGIAAATRTLPQPVAAPRRINCRRSIGFIGPLLAVTEAGAPTGLGPFRGSATHGTGPGPRVDYVVGVALSSRGGKWMSRAETGSVLSLRAPSIASGGTYQAEPAGMT